MCLLGQDEVHVTRLGSIYEVITYNPEGLERTPWRRDARGFLRKEGDGWGSSMSRAENYFKSPGWRGKPGITVSEQGRESRYRCVNVLTQKLDFIP